MQTTLAPANGPMSFPASDARMLKDVGLNPDFGSANETGPRVQKSPENRYWFAVNPGTLVAIVIIGLVIWTAGDPNAAGQPAYDSQPIASGML